jgi:hypothetical protein
MPYADPNKQRAAVNGYVKKNHQGRKGGRPVGSCTYHSPEMVELAIKHQQERLTALEKKRELYFYKTKEYRNAVAYISETRARIAKLTAQLKEMRAKSIKG